MEDGYQSVRLNDPAFLLRFRTDYLRRITTHQPRGKISSEFICDFLVKTKVDETRQPKPKPPSVAPMEVHEPPILLDNLTMPKPPSYQSPVIESRKTSRSFRHSLRQLYGSHSKPQVVLTALAVLMVVFGTYLTIGVWHGNHIAQAQATKLTAEANRLAKNSSSTLPPSTIKPTAAAVATYSVAPTLPKYIIIPKLGVDAEVRSVGLTSSGALGVPDNVYYTDWYDESALPGQQGAMLIDGHVSSWTAHGVFYGIKSLVAGDTIEIQRGDNTIFTYKVVSSKVYSSGNVNMAAAMTPIVSGQPGLNLITCTGDVIPGTNNFNERIIVFATQVSES